MANVTGLEDLLTIQKKEKKELVAITQKMKHGVPKGDKKRKKEITAEIAQLLANLELKHENELKELQTMSSDPGANKILDDGQNQVLDTESSASNQEITINDVTNDQEENLSEMIPKLSKAQKRRNKKAMIEEKRNKAILDQDFKNLNGLRHLESEEIKKKLSERHLAIHEVLSDGNCLYKAIEHQLSSLNLQQTTVQSLRELTSKYMLSHMEDYIPFLTSSETGDVLTEEEYMKYCEDIATTSAWGGHIEVQALSHVCGAPIEIIQAKGPSIFAGNESVNPKLILSYHRHAYGLGEHYNSVIPVTEAS